MDSTKDYYMIKYREENVTIFSQKIHFNLIPSLLKILEKTETLEIKNKVYGVSGFSFKPSSDYLSMYNVLIVEVEEE